MMGILRTTAPGQAWRTVGEIDCHGTAVEMDEDGDVQDDGTVLWSGCAMGACEVCGQCYADWWDGTFALGAPTGSHECCHPTQRTAMTHQTKVVKPKGWAWGQCSCGWRGRARQTVRWVKGNVAADPKRRREAIEHAEKDMAKHERGAVTQRNEPALKVDDKDNE